jgi:hypothetical protein
MMDYHGVEKKIREARFLLSKMAHQESLAFSEREIFDFYMSAFLSAGRSITWRLEHQDKRYKTWHDAWEAKNLVEKDFMKFMHEDRANEVHHAGSNRGQRDDAIRVGQHYADPSGQLIVSSPPGVPGATIYKQAYFYRIAGVDRKVTEVGRDFLRLAERIVREFQRDNP